jgi:hypothetical protein
VRISAGSKTVALAAVGLLGSEWWMLRYAGTNSSPLDAQTKKTQSNTDEFARELSSTLVSRLCNSVVLDGD